MLTLVLSIVTCSLPSHGLCMAFRDQSTLSCCILARQYTPAERKQPKDHSTHQYNSLAKVIDTAVVGGEHTAMP